MKLQISESLGNTTGKIPASLKSDLIPWPCDVRFSSRAEAPSRSFAEASSRQFSGPVQRYQLDPVRKARFERNPSRQKICLCDRGARPHCFECLWLDEHRQRLPQTESLRTSALAPAHECRKSSHTRSQAVNAQCRYR